MINPSENMNCFMIKGLTSSHNTRWTLLLGVTARVTSHDTLRWQKELREMMVIHRQHIDVARLYDFSNASLECRNIQVKCEMSHN